MRISEMRMPLPRFLAQTLWGPPEAGGGWADLAQKRPLPGLDEYQNLTPTERFSKIDPLLQGVYFRSTTRKVVKTEGLTFRLTPCICAWVCSWRTGPTDFSTPPHAFLGAAYARTTSPWVWGDCCESTYLKKAEFARSVQNIIKHKSGHSELNSDWICSAHLLLLHIYIYIYLYLCSFASILLLHLLQLK